MSETKIRPALRLVGARDASSERGDHPVLVPAPFRSEAPARRADAGPSPTGAMPSGWWAQRDAAEGAARREHAVERENRAAAAMTPTDARWVLAVRVAESLDGGRAAALPPEKRRLLVALGTRMGLRPFDSNLVIAIVQDSARTGEAIGRRLGPEVAGRLALIPAPGLVPAEADAPAKRPAWGTVLPIAASVFLALMLLRAMIVWVTG